MTEMIEGISPLQITRFRVYKANANAGWDISGNEKHPMINQMVREKYPTLSRIPILRAFVRYPERYFRPAHFDIMGGGDKWIKTIECKSDAELRERVGEAQARLDEFLANIQGKELS